MKLSELIIKLQQVQAHYRDDMNVVVLTNESTIGPRPSTSISGVQAGIDWDQGTVFLYPAVDLIKEVAR